MVSIITPSYNQAEYLEAAMRSVFAQSKEGFDLEYLVVDGASTDGSLEIIRRYAEKLAWWTSEADKGQADAINKGFKHAKGEIVAWLNSDDLYLPHTISSAVKVLEADKNLGMVFGNALTIDAQGRPLNRLVFGDWKLAELARFRIICQPAVFMRRAVLEGAGYLSNSYQFMLDHHLWLRIASLAPIRHVDQFWAAARHHPGAKNVAHADEFGRETMDLLQWVLDQPAIKQQDRRKIIGGAYRLSARYYLDGNKPKESLNDYAKAFYYYPAYSLRHWHRMISALFSLLGVKGMANWYKRIRRKAELTGIDGLEDWPGLCLKKK